MVSILVEAYWQECSRFRGKRVRQVPRGIRFRPMPWFRFQIRPEVRIEACALAFLGANLI